MKISPYLIPGIKNRSHSTIPKDKITADVCEKYNVSFELIKAHTRKPEILFPRQLLMYLLFRHGGLSSLQIGKQLNRDHSTVLRSIQVIQDYIETDSFGKREEIISFY